MKNINQSTLNQKRYDRQRIHRCIKVLIVTMLFSQSPLWSQYSIFQTGLSNDWSYNDLLSCTIINGSNKTPLVYLNCTVINNKKVVLRAQSNVFTLNKGSNILTRADVDNKLVPIKTLFADAKFRALMDKTAMPSGGEYEVKLDLVEKTENAVLSYTQNMRNVNPLSPFRLITPFDGSITETMQPIFTWTRPMGLEGQTYSIKVVEVYNGQTIGQALRSNPSLMKQEDLSFNMYQTPNNGEYLQACKKYAWQVEVVEKNEGRKNTTNISEVWSFNTSCKKEIVKYVQTPYYGAKTKPELYSYPAYDTLRISVESLTSNANNVKVKIVDVKNNVKDLTMQNEQDDKGRSLIYVGENRFAIPLIGKGLKKEAQYLLSITDGSEQYYVPFQYLGEEK